MTLRNIFLTAIIISLVVFIFPFFASAQNTYGPGLPGEYNVSSQNTSASAPADFTPLTNVNGTPFARIFSENSDAPLSTFFNTLFQTSITIGALLAVLMLAWSGWEWMTTDISDNKRKAKDRIQNALIGLLMLLATVLILRQINPDIVSLRLFQGSPSAVSIGGSGGSSNNNPGQTMVPGQTTTPEGFCVESSNVAGVYVCYTTRQECAQNYNINSCRSFSSPPGSGFLEYRWIQPGRDSDGNLLYCKDAIGDGWVDTAANYCNASPEPGSSCCGLDPSYSDVINTGEITSNPDLGIFSTSEMEFIPEGSWCYYQGSNEYACYSSLKADSCFFESGASTCLKRESSTEWGSSWVLGFPDPVADKICGDTGDIDIAPETRFACGFATIEECSSAQNGTLTNCKRY